MRDCDNADASEETREYAELKKTPLFFDTSQITVDEIAEEILAKYRSELFGPESDMSEAP
jgi:cytidylate kinase